MCNAPLSSVYRAGNRPMPHANPCVLARCPAVIGVLPVACLLRPRHPPHAPAHPRQEYRLTASSSLTGEAAAHWATVQESLACEATTLASHRHPCLLHYHGALPPAPACPTQFLFEHPEDTMLRYFARPGAFDLAALHSAACALLSAVAHLHATGTAHGDIHPDNVVVCLGPAGEPCFKLRGVGAPDWARAASPFYARPGGGASPPADLHALAMVLAEVVVMRMPGRQGFITHALVRAV